MAMVAGARRPHRFASGAPPESIDRSIKGDRRNAPAASDAPGRCRGGPSTRRTAPSTGPGRRTCCATPTPTRPGGTSTTPLRSFAHLSLEERPGCACSTTPIRPLAPFDGAAFVIARLVLDLPLRDPLAGGGVWTSAPRFRPAGPQLGDAGAGLFFRRRHQRRHGGGSVIVPDVTRRPAGGRPFPEGPAARCWKGFRRAG